jgi:hypothetical protein
MVVLRSSMSDPPRRILAVLAFLLPTKHLAKIFQSVSDQLASPEPEQAQWRSRRVTCYFPRARGFNEGMVLQ